MRFMVLVPANKDSEAGTLPDLEGLTKMGKFNEELVKAGIMLAGDGLQPTSKGSRITYSKSDKPRVVDGPFTESKELVAGYWILQAKSKEEVVEWMKRAPFGEIHDGATTIEIRQIFEPADFAPVDKDGTARARNAELQKKIDEQKAAAKSS